MSVQYSVASMRVKSLSETGGFSGYASVFDVVDSDRDVVQRGAFRKSLMARGAVKLLWQHQAEEPIGVFSVLREDEYGLYVEGRLLLEVQRGREAAALLKNGAMSGLSIGYRVQEYTIDEVTGYRLLHELELVEISLVTFPANERAVVHDVKAQSLVAQKQALMAALVRAERVLSSF